MARRWKGSSVPPAKDRWLLSHLLLVRLYDSFPDLCPDPPCPGLSVSKSSIDFYSSVFGFEDKGLLFFLKIMVQNDSGEGFLFDKAASFFPCVLPASCDVPSVFFQVPLKRKRCVSLPWCRCPECLQWLAARPLSGVISPSNRNGYLSHFFCLNCFYERYSFLPVE